MTYSECFSVTFSNFQLTERTFANYWKESNTLYLECQKSIQSELMSARIDHEKERLKKALLTFDEKREIRYAGLKNFRTLIRYIGLVNFKKSAKKRV
jgi:hypothetical protein